MVSINRAAPSSSPIATSANSLRSNSAGYAISEGESAALSKAEEGKNLGGWLGLDIGAKQAHFAYTANGETYEQGVIEQEGFALLLDSLKPVAVGMEYSGRLAEPWFLIAFGKQVPAFIMHSVMRKSITRLQRQTAKTDKKDAESIARTLRLWHVPDLRRAIGLPADLFTDAEQTRTAWVLRALLADAEAHQKTRVAAKLRYGAAHRCGMPERAALWFEEANSKQNTRPERAFAVAQEYCLTHFTAEYDLLCGIPHIGAKTAIVLIATLLPIERFNDGKNMFSKVKRYAGLHAKTEQSGTSINNTREKIGSGDRRLRASLRMCAFSVGNPRVAQSPFTALYKRLTQERGMKPAKAMNRVATALLRVAAAVLLSGKAFHDPNAAPPPPKEPIPDRLIMQSDAAREAECSRQRIGQLIAAGRLVGEAHDGKVYVTRESFDALMAKRKPKKPEVVV